jgi:hypothetical protein
MRGEVAVSSIFFTLIPIIIGSGMEAVMSSSVNLENSYANNLSSPIRSWARNDSYATACAEEDNVNVPLFARQARRYRITATHPTYEVGVASSAQDFSGCPIALAQGKGGHCDELFKDSATAVQACIFIGWWRPYSMTIKVGNREGNYHYLILYRKIPDSASWPPFLVLYEDGNLRLRPHPPTGVPEVIFGSSVIVGPAMPSSRPYVDIQEVKIDLSVPALDLTYRTGGTAHIDLFVDRAQTIATVDVNYPVSTDVPFATVRSMYVSEGYADVAHIRNVSGSFPILSKEAPLEGPWWFFYRAVPSSHNTLAPDIRIAVLE